MKLWMWVTLLLVIALLFLGAYNLMSTRAGLSQTFGELKAELLSLTAENVLLKDKLEYFKHPENLLKELKSQFNYTEAGEKLIIIVPGASTTLATSTAR